MENAGIVGSCADPFKRRYLLGCLWAFLKTTLNKRFHNLKRVKQKDFYTEIDFGFDESRILTPEQIAQRKQKLGADVNFAGTVTGTTPTTISACGAPNDLPAYQPQEQHSGIQVFLIVSDEQTRVGLRKKNCAPKRESMFTAKPPTRKPV